VDDRTVADPDVERHLDVDQGPAAAADRVPVQELPQHGTGPVVLSPGRPGAAEIQPVQDRRERRRQLRLGRAPGVAGQRRHFVQRDPDRLRCRAGAPGADLLHQPAQLAATETIHFGR
jgi:hypothetical protein